MNISPEQKERLDSLTEGSSDDDWDAWETLYNSDFVTPLQSPFELHYLANWWNWGDGKTEEVMKAILSHPLCDRGTALLIYWLGVTPDIAADETQIPSWQMPSFELAALTEARLRENKFASQIIAYNPAESAEFADSLNYAKREVPFEWTQPSPGVPFDVQR